MKYALIVLLISVLAFSFFTGKISITQAPREDIDSPGPGGKKEPGENHEIQKPGENDEEDDKPMNPIHVFPESLTVLDAAEYNAVKILKNPEAGSASIGLVYGSLMNVEVLEDSDTGFTRISTWDYMTMKPIEGYVPSDIIKTVKPQGQFQVLVSLDEQRTYIYKDGVLDRTFLNSTGIDEDSAYTPEGIYLIGDRGGSFFSGKYQQGAYNWVRFNNNYLFHSVPFDATKTLIPEEGEKLGQKASHGCIRHSIEEAQWFYDNIPRGTIVVIQD